MAPDMADGGHFPALSLVPTALGDFVLLAHTMRDDEKAQFAALTGAVYNPDTAARAYALTPGPQWVMIDAAGRAIAAAGFEPLRDGVYAAWMIGTPEAWEQHWHALTRRVRKGMADMFAHGAHRIEIQALASRTAAQAWYRDFLGMTYEGTHHGACADGQDIVMYAKVKP